MVQITMAGETSPAALLISHDSSPPLPREKYGSIENRLYRSDSRMSLEGTSEEEDSGFRDRSHSDTKTNSSSEMSLRSTASASPKSEGFSSPPMSLSHDEAQTSPRARNVLDLSSKRSKKERSFSSHALVPPYSPLSSNASSSSSSPSVTPEALHHPRQMEEVSIHDIAKRASQPQNNNNTNSSFELPKNFYGYYVYQLELASRASSRQGGLLNLPSNPHSPRSTPPLMTGSSSSNKAGHKSNKGDDEIVSYGSLLEQALRNGLKRSPSEVPSTSPPIDKRLKTSASAASTTPPSPVSHSVRHQAASQQISVEDVAKSSLRELLHSKQMQEAKMSAFVHTANSSRSSSPSINLKTLLESQKGGGRPDLTPPSSMGFAPVFPKHRYGGQTGQGGQGPMIYPHVLSRPSASPPPPSQQSRGPEGPPPPSMFLNSMSSGASFKHKKLLEWSANDVRDWVSTLPYCSEFAEVSLVRSIILIIIDDNQYCIVFLLIGFRAAFS